MKTLWLFVFFAFQIFANDLDPALLVQVEPYYLTDKELISTLDKMFTKERVLADYSSLERAGFSSYGEFHTSGIHVLKHKKLKNVLVKCFTDDFTLKTDWIHFIHRIRGAQFIDAAITARGASRYMKVPRKWIYKIPDHAPQGPHHFILIVEDMKIYGRKKNRSKWKNKVEYDFLHLFYHVINDAGAADCNFVDNVPFSEDGRVAFVDTEIYHMWPIKFTKMTHYLSPSCQQYWNHLISSGGVR